MSLRFLQDLARRLGALRTPHPARPSLHPCSPSTLHLCNLLLALTLPLRALGGSGPATQTEARASSAPARIDYSTFRQIADRNIFNASRTARGAPPPPREIRRPSRVDTFGLVGTMAYEKGPMAFFDGNSSEFRQAVRLNDKVAGWTLAAVSLHSVKLANGTNSFELPVGQSLRREDDGPWRLADGADFASSGGGREERGSSFSRSSRDGRSRDSGGSTGGSRGSTATADDGEASEVLRQLMERRAREEQ